MRLTQENSDFGQLFVMLIPLKWLQPSEGKFDSELASQPGEGTSNSYRLRWPPMGTGLSDSAGKRYS